MRKPQRLLDTQILKAVKCKSQSAVIDCLSLCIQLEGVYKTLEAIRFRIEFVQSEIDNHKDQLNETNQKRERLIDDLRILRFVTLELL